MNGDIIEYLMGEAPIEAPSIPDRSLWRAYLVAKQNEVLLAMPPTARPSQAYDKVAPGVEAEFRSRFPGIASIQQPKDTEDDIIGTIFGQGNRSAPPLKKVATIIPADATAAGA